MGSGQGWTPQCRLSRLSQSQSRRTEAIASAQARGLSAPEQALVSFEDIELGDHGVEAGGAVLTAQPLNGRIVCSVIQAAVQDRTALFSARCAPPLQRVWRLFSAHAVLP